MLASQASTCLQALRSGGRRLVSQPAAAGCLKIAGGSYHWTMAKVSLSPSLARNMCAASEAVESEAAGDSVEQRPIRPVVTAAERRQEIFLYKQQVHELRLRYKKEWDEKVQASEKSKAERAAEFWKKVEEHRRIRDEKTKVRKTIAEETLARLREEKAAEKLEKRERQAGWTQAQVEKSRERFSMQLIESRDWSCSKEEVSQLVHESLVDPARPRYVNPTRRFVPQD